LAGAFVHGYAGLDEVIANLQKFNAKVRVCRVDTDGSQQFDRDRSFPDGHGGISQA
jgi:hypothetical protein